MSINPIHEWIEKWGKVTKKQLTAEEIAQSISELQSILDLHFASADEELRRRLKRLRH